MGIIMNNHRLVARLKHLMQKLSNFYMRLTYGGVGIGMEFKKPSAWKGLETKIRPFLKTVRPVSTIVEIGVDYGYSLFCFAKLFPRAEVIGIDPFGWIDNNDDHSDAEWWVEKYLYKYPNIKLIKKNSEEAKKVFNKKIDILHIDADHRYELVKKDFCLFAPLVRRGGCVMFHDIQSYPNDVGKFFNEIEGGRREKVLEFYGLGFWYK